MLEGKERMEEVQQLFNNLLPEASLISQLQKNSQDHNKVQRGLGNLVASSAGAF